MGIDGGTQRDSTTPWASGDPANPVLERIGPTECMSLLERGGVGRVAVATGDRVLVLPVNYTVHDGRVVFRTRPDSVLARSAGGRVTIEVDQIDDRLRCGWSVLVSGPAYLHADSAARTLRGDVHVEPWAGGHRDLYVFVTPEEISGRRVHD
jgi:nitroimidazol reductase NimA-like FMN-containing flavoprotein (pyridoxamine 5'-phosphate oxidase superfamily)